MPEKIGMTKDTPRSGYQIRMIIKDLEYTNDLREVNIISTLNKPYQIVVLTLELDSNDIILEDTIANEPIKLKIKLLGRKWPSPQILESIDLELQHISSDNASVTKSNITKTKQKDRVKIDMWTIPRKPYKTMNTSVNGKYENKKVKDIIQDLVGKTSAELKYDSDDQNEDEIEQLFLPPMTVYKAIQTLDNNYGIFNAASNMGFCQHDNKIHIQNLTKRMNKDQAFTIYHLSGGNAKNARIIDQCGDGKKFYTEGDLKTDYQGPSVLHDLGTDITYIVKPKDKLYKKITKNIKNDIFSNFGAIAKNKTIKTDSNLDSVRKRYIGWGHSGNNDSEAFINATLAKKIIGLATVELAMQKNLRILNLMKIGEAVKLKSETIEYKRLSDKYLLQASKLTWTRTAEDWNSSVVVKLMRSNQYTH